MRLDISEQMMRQGPYRTYRGRANSKIFRSGRRDDQKRLRKNIGVKVFTHSFEKKRLEIIITAPLDTNYGLSNSMIFN